MIEREKIQDTIGAMIGVSSFAVKKVVEAGFNWSHYSQEMIEDLSGAVISVTVGFFLMKLWRKMFPEKKERCS